MKTVLTQTIEETLTVVIGFDKPVIDPVATKQKVISKKYKPEDLEDSLPVITREEFADNIVYFEPRLGEEIITEKEYKELSEKFNKLKRNELLLREGSVIPDNRGKLYWLKENGEWVEHIMDTVGYSIPTTAITDPTPEQINEIMYDKNKRRIRGLPENARKLEKQQMLELALSRAATRKTELEILGDKDPLGKAQLEYEERKKEIENLYQ